MITCSLVGVVDELMAIHAAEPPLQLRPYCGTSGLHTFKKYYKKIQTD